MLSKNIYSIPVSTSDFKIAISDSRVHHGQLKYAIDFPLKEGTKVLAAQDGVVIDIKDDSKRGGDNPKFLKDANYITIEHNEKEMTQYNHLAFHGSLVKVGDLVKKGERIGNSGNTGYSTEPHLHFMVIKGNPEKWETIEPRFDKDIKIEYFPKS